MTLFGQVATSSAVSLAWDPSPDTNVVGYAIYYGTNSGDYRTRVEVGNQTNTVIPGLTNPITYYFVATAYTVEGLESLPSNEVSYRPDSGTTPTVPMVTIVTPVPGTVTNTSLNLAGIASDDLGVTLVRWSNVCNQVSGLATGTTNWSVSNLPLCVGSNFITIRAQDADGNVGTAGLGVVRLDPFTAITVAPTSFSLPATATSFCVSVTASPGQTWIASSGGAWVQLVSAGVQTGTGSACFVAAANSDCFSRTGTLTVAGRTIQVLQTGVAPQMLVARSFTGLFTNGASQLNSGLLTLKSTASGAFSGRIVSVGGSWSFKGQFDSTRRAVVNVPRLGRSTLNLQLQLAVCDAGELTGWVGDGSTTAALLAYRNEFNLVTNACPVAGKYTFVVPGTAAAQSPPGHGFGSLSVLSNGTLRIVGALGDGTKFRFAGWLSAQHTVAFYVPLYARSGSLYGWLSAKDDPTAGNPHGQLSWTKPIWLTHRFYPRGFTNQVEIVGSRYLPPVVPSDFAIGFTNGLIRFIGANLPDMLDRQVILLPGNVATAPPVTNSASGNLSLRIKTSQGLFSGSVSLPLLGRSLKYQGALLQNLNAGYGFCVGTNQTGEVIFAAPLN